MAKMSQGRRKKAMAEMRKSVQGILDEGLEKLFEQRGEFDPFSMTLDEREEMAKEIGRQVAGYLLEKQLGVEAEAYPEELPTCPVCRMIARRSKDAKGRGRLKEVRMQTRVGEIELSLPVFECPKCRKRFSPLGKQMGDK